MGEVHEALAIAFGVLVASMATAMAHYPSRPITIIVPFPAGGPTGTLARILADHMATSLAQSVIIENVSGAAGSIGVGRVARAAADGYTLSIGHWSTHVVNGATMSLACDVLHDFAPVSLLADTPIWMVARKTLPPKNLTELIGWLKQNPGKATAGTVGVGGASDVTGSYFQRVTGTTFQFVPYRGAAPLNHDLVAGHIDLMLGMAAATYLLVRSGQIKAYAMMTKSRWWGRTRCSNHGRGRSARPLCFVLARVAGPQGDAHGHHQQAQFCGTLGAGRPIGAAAICR